MNRTGSAAPLAAIAALLLAGAAHAHRGHESQIALALDGPRLLGRWTIAQHDTPATLPPAPPALGNELLAQLQLAADGAPCALRPLAQAPGTRAGAAAWVIAFEARCAGAPRRLTVELRGLFERDPKHLVLLKLEAGAWARAAMFTAGSARQSFEPAR